MASPHKHYIEYLIHTPNNYTATHMSKHHASLSHDEISRFLGSKKLSSRSLWRTVRSELEDTVDGMLIVDDSVHLKRYSRFIKLVKRQYSGNEKGVVQGIGIVNLVHSSGNDGDYFPIDYRIYHPETDGKTKNAHFQAMFKHVVNHKNLQTRTIAFDTWYASATNLKLIHRSNWRFFTTLKTNRLVSLSKEIGYQSLESLDFTPKTLQTGLIIRLKKIPFPVKLFKFESPDGHIDWIITNDLDETVNLFVAELKNDNRWQVEVFHREIKQLTGIQKCQARTERSQRNHIASSYQAWLSLKIAAKKAKTTIYQIKESLWSEYLIQQLATPTIKAVF